MLRALPRWAAGRPESRSSSLRQPSSLEKTFCFRYIRSLSPQPSPPMTGFYSCFSDSADKWPQNIAVEVQRERSLDRHTYAELRSNAEAVGRWLTENRVAGGARC